MRSRSFGARWVAAATAVPILAGAGLFVGLTDTAGASSGPFTPSVVSTTTTTHAVCRAYGGSLSANQESDQDLTYKVTAPDAVQPGQTFDIKIRPQVSGFPATDTSSGTSADIAAIFNTITKWKLPAGVTINSASLGPINGDTAANPEAGFYVAPADVPKVNVPGKGSYPDPNFDPMTLPAAKRIAIPGTAPATFSDTAANTVRIAMLGTGSESSGTVYPGGSMVQPPTLTVNVTTSTAVAAGTDLGIKLAGSLPPSGNLAGSQPNNFGAPTNMTVNRTNATSSDTVWTDPGFVTYVQANALGGLIKIVAKTACAAGWEATPEFPTAPAYYTGPNAIPNGTAPLMNHTTVVGVGSTAPFEGASYVTGASVPAAYSCIANPAGETYDTCVGDVPVGDLIDTSTPGPHTFTINATDAFQDPITRTINYNVADPLAPVANAGTAQTGKVAGNVVTLNGSATDPNGPPALPLTYSWTQTSGPAVTLSDATAAKPTFTVPPVDNPAGASFGFDLTVNNGYFSNTSSTTVSSVASTPTVVVSQARPGGTGTIVTGDLMTLNAAITNPDGNASADYTYAWTKTTGLAATLSSTTAANPTYTMPVNGAAACTNGTGATNCPRFSVVVTKTNTGKASTAAALASSASSLPTRPVANAGANQNVANAGGEVTLDGSASTQANGHTISYAWTQTAGDPVTLSDPTAQKPTFTAPAATSSANVYSFSLVVTDTQNPIAGSGTNGKTSLTASTTVTVLPDHVVAAATSTPASPVAGGTVTLDGSGSTDPNLAPLTYAWTQTSGPAVTLSDATAAKPTFVAPPATSPAGTTLEFSLAVTNGGADPEDSATTTATVTITPSTPTAVVSQTRQGGGATNFTGDVMTLNAAITNPDGNASGDYTYVWTKTTGLAATLSSTTAANPTYTMPANGTSACTNGTGSTNCPRFSVVVTKTNTGKSSAAAALASSASSLPTRPVANAGSAQSKTVATAVTLDGSGSTQAQGHTLSYAWTQTAGTPVTLSDATAQKPTFTPASTGSLTFSLVVTDTQNPLTTGSNQKTSSASTVIITVTNQAPTAVIAPVAPPLAGDTVTLDGSGSSDPDGHALTYAWTQTGGTPVALSDATAQQPTFTAPAGPAALTFQLIVSDAYGGVSAPASTIVSVGNSSPHADAGPDASGFAPGDVVGLDGTGSTDPDGDDLTYSWTQTAGPAVTLDDPTSATPSFAAPVGPATLTFELTVSDGNGGSDTDTVSIGVTGIAGLDLSSTVEGEIAPSKSVSKIKATINNLGNTTQTVADTDLVVSGTVNGAPINPAQFTVTAKTASIKAGKKTTPFTITWSGYTLQAGDVVELTVCIDRFGDSVPENNCGTVTAGSAINLSASSTVNPIPKTATGSPVKVAVTNESTTAKFGPLAASDVTVVAKVNGNVVGTVAPPASGSPVTLKEGATKTYAFRWTHPKLTPGDHVEFTTCVNVPGNTSPSSCSTTAQDIS